MMHLPREDKLVYVYDQEGCPLVYVYVDGMATFAAENWYANLAVLFCLHMAFSLLLADHCL